MARKTNKGNAREIVTMKEARKSKKKRVTVARKIQYDTVTKHYLAEFNYGIVDGKTKRERKTFLSLEEAKEALARFEVEKLNGLPENISKKITFGECIDEFITARQIEETTRSGYIVIANRIRKSPLYGKLLKDVNENDIENYMQEMKQTGKYKNATINSDYSFIHSVLQFAIKRRYITTNKAVFVEKMNEKGERFVAKIVDYSEFATFLEKVTNTNDMTLIAEVYLGMLQGMRRGEMIGLKWEKVNFEENTIAIDETITLVGGKTIKKQPKTEQSKRTLTMNARVRELLLHIREQEMANGSLCEYVIHNTRGEHARVTTLSEKFKAFVDKNGFEGVRLHDLRHSYANASLKMGATIYAVSGALGHSNIATTANYYVHTKAQDGSKAINAVLNF